MAVQTPYVEYIKISRTDELGQDLTPTLEALTQIKLPFTNGVSKTYYPISRTKYNDYFLFSLSKNGNSAPLAADTSTIDYIFSASLSNQIFSGVNIPGQGISNPVPITSPSTNLFNIDNTKISINTYIQKEVTFTVNFTASITGGPAEAKILKNGIGTSTSVALSVGTSNNSLSFTVDSSSLFPDTYFELDLQAPLPSGPYSYTYQLQGNSSWVISSTAASGPTLETIPEPYLTSQFEGTDCDVLLNNEELYRENPFLQDIDYSENPFVPVNFNLLLNGSAAKGTVPASYYTSLSHINSRYIGSKNQSSDFNIYNPLARGTDFGDNVNIGTYGQTPSVSSLDINIYEFEWGGGTTPEIVGYGAVKMGRILQVSSKDLVKTINASDGASNLIIPNKQGHSQATARNYRQVEGLYPPESVNTMSVGTNHFWLTTQSISDYYQILNGNNPVNSEISMYMYPNSTAGSNPTLPSSTKILNTEWGVPTISNYALTSSFTESLSTINNYGFIRNGNANIYLYRNQHISRVKTDANGYYNGGSRIKPNISTLGDEINKDLNNGEKWFVTLFSEFEFPNGKGDYNSALTTGSLTPYNVGFTEKDSNGNYSSPLAFKGVYEILGTDDTFGDYFYILTDHTFTENRNIGGNNTANTPLTPFNILGSITGNSLGMLIWKAKGVGKNEFVIVQDSITGGVQAGAFINRYAPDYITENFESITKEYGSNQTG